MGGRRSAKWWPTGRLWCGASGSPPAWRWSSEGYVGGAGPPPATASPVAHALVRAASALLPTPGCLHANGCRDESRHGTHECVRHIFQRRYLPWLFRDWAECGLRGPTMKVELSRVAHTRSGDKGDTANIGVIAWRDSLYPVLVREVTAERVKTFFGDLEIGR